MNLYQVLEPTFDFGDVTISDIVLSVKKSVIICRITSNTGHHYVYIT